MGYHQLAIALASQEKLAFQGPDAIKWTYTIMTFGPTNGPATFITFIHDIDSQWKPMAQQKGLIIDDNTNCINYILLNSVTRIIAYPIPRYDLAINEEFGQGVFFWLWDAPMEYHQLAVALASQEKLAFQGPDAIKWTYTIMTFGPTNGPATFITFIHDIDSQWKAMAQQKGLIIDDNTNTKIIVDDIFSWAKSLSMALIYIKCQLCVCQAYPLSLSLQKSHIFPKFFEFVGIDICSDGNCPTMSKHQILEHWPQLETVCDVAQIIGFAQFYSKFILQFELRIAPLCNLTTN